MEEGENPAAPPAPQPKKRGAARAREGAIRAEALAHLQALGWDPPTGSSFSREEANERGA